MLQVCDLKVIKTKCSDFKAIYQAGFGAYSHQHSGSNFFMEPN